RRFHLIAVFEHAHGVVLLEGVIVVVSAGAELDLLDGDKGLLSFGLFLLLLLLVLPFAEIDNAANRRFSLRRHFDQIKSLAAGDIERLERRHDAELCAVVVNHANLGHADALVNAPGRAAVAPITKIPSSLKATNSRFSRTGQAGYHLTTPRRRASA